MKMFDFGEKIEAKKSEKCSKNWKRTKGQRKTFTEHFLQ